MTCLFALVQKIGIFFGLAAFELPCSRDVVVVAVWVSVLNIRSALPRCLLHPGRGGGEMLGVVRM